MTALAAVPLAMPVGVTIADGIVEDPDVCPEISGQHGFADPTGRTQVSATSSLSTISMLVAGQSLAITIAPTPFTPSANVENFDFYNGKNYVAKESLLGPERVGGNVGGADGGCLFTRLASSMRDANMAQRVVITNCAIGSTNFDDLYPPGNKMPTGLRTRFALRAMQRARLDPSVVYVQMGETATLIGQKANVTKQQIRAFVAHLRQLGCRAPVFFALSTKFNTKDRTETRQGIMDACNDALGIYLGPDTDTIGDADRMDGTHWKDSGSIKAANLWLANQQAWLAADGSRSLLMA